MKWGVREWAWAATDASPGRLDREELQYIFHSQEEAFMVHPPTHPHTHTHTFPFRMAMSLVSPLFVRITCSCHVPTFHVLQVFAALLRSIIITCTLALPVSYAIPLLAFLLRAHYPLHNPTCHDPSSSRKAKRAFSTCTSTHTGPCLFFSHPCCWARSFVSSRVTPFTSPR